MSAYLDVDVDLSHLVIAHDAVEMETANQHWLALNPMVGRVLGWRPTTGGWFRWVNEQGVPVVEGVWWSSGRHHHFNHYAHDEVGEGWLVVITEQGFRELSAWAAALCRGGVVWRRLGWYGAEGKGQAVKHLSLE